MLGQSLFLLGPLVAAFLALYAFRNAADHGFAIAALSAAALELLGLVALFVITASTGLG